MSSYHVIVVVFGILIFFILGILYFVNRLIFYQNRIFQCVDVVQKYLDERVTLFQQMSDFVQNHLEHEETFLDKIQKCSSSFSIRDRNFIPWFQNSEKVVLQFAKFSQVYPKLKKDSNYLDLCQMLDQNRDQILYAIDGYDKGVLDYNNYRKRRIVFFISKLFRFADYNYYHQTL